MTPPHFPEILVALDSDGLGGDNIYVITGRVRRGLRDAGEGQETIQRFTAEIRAARSYSDALDVVRAWVRTS